MKHLKFRKIEGFTGVLNNRDFWKHTRDYENWLIRHFLMDWRGFVTI